MIIKTIKNWWLMAVGVIRYKVAMKKADAKHLLDGKRYYVVPSPFGIGKVMILCNRDIKELKRRGYIKKSFGHLECMENCLYFTDSASKNDHSRMSDEEVREKKAVWIRHLKRFFK